MGRWTKERHAQEAAKKAEKAAKAVEAAPVEQTEPQVEPEVAPNYETPAPRGNPRDEIMEELVARRHREAGIQEEPQEPKAEEKQPEEKPEEKQEEAVAEDKPEATTEKPLVKVKVDGEEFEVSQDEIDEAGGVRAYRTQRAAENRLKESKEALAQAKRLEAHLLQMAQAQANPKKPEPTEDELILSKLDEIRYGTKEEGAAALREVLNRQRIDPRQITDQATQAAVVHMARTNASQKFGEEFSEITTNHLLMELASTLENKRLAQLRAEGKNPASVDWNDFYRRIGNEIRSVVRPSQPTAPVTNGNPSPASAKEERKASIVNLPTASTRAELPKEEKPETREDTLAEMRKGRRV